MRLRSFWMGVAALSLAALIFIGLVFRPDGVFFYRYWSFDGPKTNTSKDSKEKAIESFSYPINQALS